MYQGKYEGSKHLSARQRKTAERRKRRTLLLSFLLVLCVSVGGTLAYIVTQTEAVTNIFNPSTVSTKVNETISGTEKSNVTITNTGDTDAYIRAAILINWVDEQGNIYGSVPDSCAYTIEDPAESNWTKIGGYYYYKGVVSPMGTTGDTTTNLINSISPAANVPDGYYLQVTILSSGVQATPDKTVQEAWKMSFSNGSWTEVTGN